MRRIGLCFSLVGLSALAAEPLNVTNTVDVSSGGAIAGTVALHRATYAAWLNDPDYNSWTNYTPKANVHYEYPQIVRLTCGAGGEELFLTNLCPGTTYPYSLATAGGGTVSGTFTTAPAAPRWLLAPIKRSAASPTYVSNFRDLGGWEIPGGNGRRTNFNVFFRSASLDNYFISGTDNRGTCTLHSELGINTELDLRGGNNVTTVNGGTGVIENESYYFTTNVARCVVGYGPDNAFTTAPCVNDGSIRYFRVTMTTSAAASGSSSAEEIRKAFHVLGTAAYHPVLFHCAGGRDRTGFIAAMIEALCGLSEEQVFRDHLSIVFAAQSSMYAERIDGNLRELYARRDSNGQLLYAQYGDSLAGHARAYLESIGVTAGEIATITQAYVGETPAEVLARVDAYEAAKHMRTVYYVTRETARTNAVHRVGDGDPVHEPLIALPAHYDSYNLVRDEYKLAGWTDETAVDATHGERYSLWTEDPQYTVTFRDPFGSVLKTVTVPKGTDATAQIPSAPAGTVITGWDRSVADVQSNLTVTCTMTGVSGYLGSAGTAVTDPAILARGGDAVYAHDTSLGREYVHIFTSTNGVSTFTPGVACNLLVSYLVVGGGGMSGDSSGTYFGAGGGGGGGVVGSSAVLAMGESWAVRVGAGGSAPGSYTKARIAAQGSSISNATAAIALAPGGGAGQSCSTTVSTLTGEANGGGAYSRGSGTGAKGTFRSVCDGVTYALTTGGSSAKAIVDTQGTRAYALPGGGAGAGGDGGSGNSSSRTAGHGGLGVYSSITGELRVYGAGGGGGGGVSARSTYAEAITNALGYTTGFFPGEGANGGGRGGFGVSTSYMRCQRGADGFGGGAGGAGAGKSNPAGTMSGGNGVVILRYTLRSLSEPTTFDALGNRGAVSYSCTGETTLHAGDIYITPGTTATISATDAGGAVCGCWRDDSTGELFWGATVEVTPETFTRYTACFGEAWLYDATAGAVSNGGWTFKAACSGSALTLTQATASPAAGGCLNLATPVTNAAGAAYSIVSLGNSSSIGGSDGFFGIDTKNAHRQKLTTLFLAGSTTKIGKRAFNCCTNLTGTVCFPTNLTFYKYAFQSCSNLTGIVLKGGVGGRQTFHSDGYQFYSCTRLKGDVVIPDGNTALAPHLFRNTAITGLTIPTNVTSVGSYFANGCSKLVRVTPFLPPTVESVGDLAFCLCSKLQADRLELPKVKLIPYQAFSGVPLSEVVLPAVTNVAGMAFSSSKLVSVTFGPQQVAFEANHGSYTYGYGPFTKTAAKCSYHFPGKAPLLKSDGALIGGEKYAGIVGSKVQPMFGTASGIRFYGSWLRDPVGWQKIFDDGVGTPLADVSYAVPTDLEPHREVKGVFRALSSSSSTIYGWLVDQARGSVLFIK